jgi:hypothetical protein
MNQLALTNDIINISHPLLTVKELLNNLNYQYNDIYLDKFWQNIKDDMWIYIDDNMLKYIGYHSNELWKEKQNYLNLVKRNFDIIVDYKYLNSKDFKLFLSTHEVPIENNEYNEHNKVKHLIVSPDCFKQSLMLLQTPKSKEIKKYYIELEKVFKFYLEYQNEYRKLELENKQNELENKQNELEEKENIINTQKKEINDFISVQTKTVNKLKKDEFVYLATNKLNSKNNIFKIGKCNHLTGRLSTFNTNSLFDNEYYYANITTCHNSRILEGLIHSLLSPFNYKNELFQLHYKPLSNLFNQISMQYDIMTNLVNDYIENNYIDDIKLENITPEKINHKETNIYDNARLYNKEEEETKEEIKEENNKTELEMNTLSMDDNYYLYQNTKLYICPRNCSFACKERNTMLNHMSRVYLCEKIETDKYLKENLSEELIDELIQKNNIKYKICEDCGRYFVSSSKYNRHKMSQESCKNVYECERCNRRFRLMGDYNAHTRNIYCLDEDGNRINCDDEIKNEVKTEASAEVETEMNTNNGTNGDNFIIHNGVKIYKCELCEKLFNSSANLKSHLKKKNKCNLVHKCEKCSREFHSLENKNKHLNQKTDCRNQVFECSKCKKKFTTNRNLSKHLREINCV